MGIEVTDAEINERRMKLRTVHADTGLTILNGADEGMKTAPLWLFVDPRNQRRYLVRELYAWAAQEEAHELLGLV